MWSVESSSRARFIRVNIGRIHSIFLYTASGPKPNVVTRARKSTPTKEFDASRLSLLQATFRDTLGFVHLGCVAGRLERVASGRQGLKVGTVVLVGLGEPKLVENKPQPGDRTDKRNTAVSTSSNLGLVGVDEDLRVAERTAAAVTADDLGLCPPHGLLVNELNSGVGSGL